MRSGLRQFLVFIASLAFLAGGAGIQVFSPSIADKVAPYMQKAEAKAPAEAEVPADAPVEVVVEDAPDEAVLSAVVSFGQTIALGGVILLGVAAHCFAQSGRDDRF